MEKLKKERILIKLSGGALKGDKRIYEEKKIFSLVSQIKEISENYEVGIVIGGGNIWRGKNDQLDFLSSSEGDYLGMLATIMNSWVLRTALEKNGVKAECYSALEVERIVRKYSISEIQRKLLSGEVIIFGGGLGEPQFSTDSAAIIRGLEIDAKKILIGKDGVQGVYNKDPKMHKDAIFYEKLSYEKIIQEDLKVLDHSALNLAKENKLHLLIFNQEEENSFVRSLLGNIKMSEVF